MAEGDEKTKVFNIYVGCDGDNEDPDEIPREVKLPDEFLAQFNSLMTKVETVLNSTNDMQTRFEALSVNYTNLERKVATFMSQVDEGLGRITGALANVSADIDRLNQAASDAAAAHGAQLAQLQQQIQDILTDQDATVNQRVQEAIDTFNAETTAKVQAVAEQAEALAARVPEPAEEPDTPEEPEVPEEPDTPDEPAPEPEPEPTPDEPAPDEPQNPNGDNTFIP